MVKLYPIMLLLILGLICSVSFQACVMDSTSQSNDNPRTQKITSSAKDAISTPTGIPPGCGREWSISKGDSVIVCADPTPPQIK